MALSGLFNILACVAVETELGSRVRIRIPEVKKYTGC
jgi:hypothetical protein